MALIDMLPQNHKNSKETSDIQNVQDIQVKKIQDAKDDLFLQLSVETATWGLTIWEKALALITDITKSYDFRRSRIESKLRSQGVTTKAMMQNVAISFSNGATDIIEYPAEYRFEVKFTGTIGIPPNMEDLTNTIEEIKPAHLAYAYVYVYITHETLHKYTHAQLAAYTHIGLRNGGLT